MRNLRFGQVVWLGVGSLGFVVALAMWLVHDTARSWSEKDVALRAELAVSSAHAALVKRWHDERLAGVLDDIARDERIVGAAACSRDMLPIAQTDGFPVELRCAQILDRSHGSDVLAGKRWSAIDRRGGRAFQLTAIPVTDGALRLGSILLVHDLGFAARREAIVGAFVLLLLMALTAGAWVLLQLTKRTTLRDSAARLRSSLQLGSLPAELHAVADEVRAQLEECAQERGGWTLHRLHEVLKGLGYERALVVVSMRSPEARTARRGPPSLLENVLIACSGVWVTTTASDKAHNSPEPGSGDSYSVRRFPISANTLRGHERFASGLVALATSDTNGGTFSGDGYSHYHEVNRLLAEHVLEAIDADDPLILVDDHGLGLLPRLLKEQLPHATVIMLWRRQWPDLSKLARYDQARALIEGMLAADIVVFRATGDCERFLDSVDQLTKAVADRRHGVVAHAGRRSQVRSSPTPLEWSAGLSGSHAPVDEERRDVLDELGIATRDALLCVQVDTSTSSNRIERTLRIVERLLEKFPEFRGRFVLGLLTLPVAEVGRMQNGQSLAARLNERFGTRNYRPVVVLPAPSTQSRRMQYYRAADICWASSPSKSIDRVSREFLLAHEDGHGVLVVDRFLDGSTCPGAISLNPYDPEQGSDMLATALRMTPEERRSRMHAARRYAAGSSAYGWFGTILSDLGQVTDRDRSGTFEAVPSPRSALDGS